MNFDPIHWAAVALGVALVAAGTWGSVQTSRLDRVTTEYNMYKGTVKAEAERNQAVAAAEKSRLLAVNSEIDRRYNETKSSLDITYAQYDRMLKQSESDRSRADSLAAIAGNLARNSADESGFAEKMGRLEAGVISRLAKPRDEVILLLNECLAFARNGE